MKNISEIFRDGNFYEEAEDETAEADENAKSCENTDDGKRRMYCPRCYSDFYAYNGICPECGAVLEEPLTEEEAEEFMEVLFSTRL